MEGAEITKPGPWSRRSQYVQFEATVRQGDVLEIDRGLWSHFVTAIVGYFFINNLIYIYIYTVLASIACLRPALVLIILSMTLCTKFLL